MKIYIITQEDSFVIPKNIELLNSISFVKIVGACIIKSKNSLSNKKHLFIKNFNLFQVSKMGFLLFYDKFLNFLDLIFWSNFLKNKKSVKAICKKNSISYRIENNINNNNFISYISKLNIDLIVSFSAPSIFKNKLLSLPSKGCINLHCSLLPKYSGILPSFWALYYDEKFTGATVHYMDDEIDNGDILGQSKVEIMDTDSMFNIIKKTKKAGGKLMVDVVNDINNNTVKLIKNKVEKENYYSWPSDSEFKNFAKKRRLI